MDQRRYAEDRVAQARGARLHDKEMFAESILPPP
jgi:hypothetical protein